MALLRDGNDFVRRGKHSLHVAKNSGDPLALCLWQARRCAPQSRLCPFRWRQADGRKHRWSDLALKRQSARSPSHSPAFLTPAVRLAGAASCRPRLLVPVSGFSGTPAARRQTAPAVSPVFAGRAAKLFPVLRSAISCEDTSARLQRGTFDCVNSRRTFAQAPS